MKRRGVSVGALAIAMMLLAPVAFGQALEGKAINLFDGETLYGWTTFGDAGFKVVDGAIVCEEGSGGWLATSSQFADFELTASVRVSPKATTGIAFRAGLENHPSEDGTYVITLTTPENATPEWQTVVVKAVGNEVSATVNGQPVEKLEGRRPLGHIGIQYHHNNKAKVEVKDVTLRPLNLKSIFNGQDLTGWEIIPDRKSEFKVVDGALNIVNGNGQIETSDLYKDFVLQLDIYAKNDNVEKPLNSGVFYRTPKGVFWKGYEIQVRNQYSDGDRSKPVDFGTGGNYGNQPARKVIPNENEWYTMTIVVDGNHAAAWVNGYQVSDFTDTRPASEDAQGKAGYVAGPGTINLQGHDPTTNMSFKNINIQSYPERRAARRQQ